MVWQLILIIVLFCLAVIFVVSSIIEFQFYDRLMERDKEYKALKHLGWGWRYLIIALVLIGTAVYKICVL